MRVIYLARQYVAVMVLALAVGCMWLVKVVHPDTYNLFINSLLASARRGAANYGER
jgi:hypothetical protein